MAKDAKKEIKQRIIFIQVLMVSLIFLLCAKSFDIQIFQAEELARKASGDYSRDLLFKGDRGQILDRSMNKLATSIDALSITACPRKIENPDRAARELARILQIDRKPLQKTLSSKRMFAWIARRVSPDQAEAVKKLALPGIYFEKESKRFYPNRNLAAQVIGFTGSDDTGLEGLEFKYNSVLEGSVLKTQVKRDGNGRILNLDEKKRAELKGRSIVLTLDKKIQFLSEQTLERTVKEHRAKSGMALVMRPGTGELLAMAHYPEFNPNNFMVFENEVFRNRAVTDAFEPGSAMKVFTAAAALERGFAPKSIFFCENGTYKISGYTIHDTHEHDWLTINQIIKYSSNIGAAKIVETIGDKALYNTLTRFGFGGRTGVDAPGETSGTLLPYPKWTRVDAGAISFGQGVSVSALQLITGISAIANGGTLMKPLLVKKIISNQGQDLKVFHPQKIRQVVTPDIALQIKKMMGLAVTDEGTGNKAAIDGYSVCGKTGTAQKVIKGQKGYARNKYISVFAGFAPEENPELAILVVVDEPKRQYYGGDVAAPAFKSIMAESFSYLNIAPVKATNMLALLSSGEEK